MQTLINQAIQLDQHDELATLKAQFDLPEGVVYLDGNSLGPLTHAAKKRAIDVLQHQWGQDLIKSWNKHQWIELPTIIGNKIAKLIGAEKNSVVCCDSISVNLCKLLSAALNLSQARAIDFDAPVRNKVLSQQDNFPTDLYMVQGLSELMGSERCELLSVTSDKIISTLENNAQDIAVLLLTHVNFKNGDIHDMQAITQLAHDKGVLVIWDLAHSAGVIPLHLAKCKVDFAVGCTYKYLNGGPGSPAFAYVAPQHLAHIQQPLRGWMGHAKPFDFAHDYEKAQGIEQLLCGTPSIVSMSIVDAALAVFEDLEMLQVRKKSIALNAFFQECVEQLLAEKGIAESRLRLACRVDASERGSQISFAHEHAYALCQALIEQGVIGDFRAPNILRLGFSPLFLSFNDVFIAASTLVNTLASKAYLGKKYMQRNAVT